MSTTMRGRRSRPPSQWDPEREQEQRVKALYAEAAALEEVAGIAEAVAAVESRYNHRQEIRDACFSVADSEQRVGLIKKRLEIEAAVARSDEFEVSGYRRRLWDAQAAAEKMPSEMAAIIAAGCVAIGWLLFKMAGAVGGAIVGYFIGNDTIHNAKVHRRKVAEQAEVELQDRLKVAENDRQRWPYFTHRESRTGARDRRFDDDQLAATEERGESEALRRLATLG